MKSENPEQKIEIYATWRLVGCERKSERFVILRPVLQWMGSVES
jgi:hypothetical protein